MYTSYNLVSFWIIPRVTRAYLKHRIITRQSFNTCWQIYPSHSLFRLNTYSTISAVYSEILLSWKNTVVEITSKRLRDASFYGKNLLLLLSMHGIDLADGKSLILLIKCL